MNELLSEFLIEASESIDELDALLLELAKNPGDRSTLNKVFRILHNVKGACGFVELNRLEAITHAAEASLDVIRRRPGLLEIDQLEALLSCVDLIREILNTLEERGHEPPGEDGKLIHTLTSFAKREPVVQKEQKAPEHMVEEFLKTTTHVPEEGSIRVKVPILEELITTVSELVLTRNQILRIHEKDRVQSLEAPLQRLNAVTSQLQATALKARMQPIGISWSKLPRLVHELSQMLDKKIELQMVGGETELDRRIIEALQNPIMHMIRNAADHGLESTDERLEVGKPEAGTITVQAYHQTSTFALEIKDDGRGISLGKIKDKLLQKKLMTPKKINQLDDHELMQTLFLPGFSTAEEITALSGRGVGMDVLKTNIERLGGTIRIHSEEGQGTTFILTLPTTLAIMEGMTVRILGDKYVLPMEAVREVQPLKKSQRLDGKKKEKLLFIDDYLQGQEQPKRRKRDYTILWLEESFGLVVDDIEDTQEVVVKPPSKLLSQLPIYSGSTILGCGNAALILDPNQLIKVRRK